MARKTTKKASASAASTINFAENVFGPKEMKKYLSDKTYRSLSKTIKEAGKLDPKIADEVAAAMKKWAISKGATHYSHWFQPLTGASAEKHDSFFRPDYQGGLVEKFDGDQLIQGEPDASSFPSGGLRATFEARGYTGWDPTSPAFIKESPAGYGSTLTIPTVFCGYHGEALDKKTPLLRSMRVLSEQVCRLGELFGISSKGKQAYATLGGEQEYFLIDKEFYYQRIDLVQTGRTLFGREPAKHQQLDDHYFGAIKTRVMGFMEDLDQELWKNGIPATTRHNEVAPGQYEIAPVFENLNLGVDHNILKMEIMKKVAERHDFVCLLHEKPFAGVNGSGKHNNWAITGPDGKNWLSPGSNPHENAKFLTVLCAVIKAVDTHAGLIRASIASASNDHRLGANEAPPAIISIFLGEQLYDIVCQLEKGVAKSSKQGGTINIGVDHLPELPRDATDRNRTSPFAFTGAKFELRAAGSAQSLAAPNIVLNTAVADALDEICSELEKTKSSGKNFNKSLQKVLQGIVKKHKRVLFNGDNYTTAWHKEAAKRGLPNLRTTPEALKEIKKPAAVKVFEKHNVLSKKELESRYEVYQETYETVIGYESQLALDMARTMILPVSIEYQAELVEASKATKSKATKDLLTRVVKETDKAIKAADKLEAVVGKATTKQIAALAELRSHVDELEGLLPHDRWPLPSYAEMLFLSN